MSHKRTIALLLFAYLLGTFLLVVIQYNWGKNLNTLITGNEKLVQEFTLSGRMKELERDVLSVESRIRGTITTQDTTFLNGLEAKIESIETELEVLKTSSGKDSSLQYIVSLERLVHSKIERSRNLVRMYFASGKKVAGDQVASQAGRRLTDSIMLLAQNFEISRQRHLAAVMSSVDSSGTNSLHLGIVLIATVLLCGALVFWYILHIIRRQNSLILQLHLSERKVREAAILKENFLANMSHEIRTPLNAILGFTSLLQKKPELDGDSKHYVQTIHRSGENLLAILNDILDISKMEAGMMRIEPVPFSLRNLLQSVVALLRPRAEEKGLALLTRVKDDVPDALEGDAVRLTQILVNLVGNAVKFTASGQVLIAVSAADISADTVHLRIAVSDTGMGIAPEKLHSIFNRFQQGEGSVTRRYGGSGLGLTIAKDLVVLQGGTIHVQSEPGKGATFWFIIPYQISFSQNTLAADVLPAGGTNATFRGFRVLVVEDNEVNQELMQQLFRHWQVSGTMAANGREAIRRLQHETFDLILMDIQMPEMDGYTATEKIRNELHLQTPIIAMTAHAMAGELEKCLQAGMNAYITKPVREEALLELFHRFSDSGNSVPPEPCVNGPTASFRFLQLNYLHAVSAGDKAYEMLAAGQFLELLPAGLQALETALLRQNWEGVRRETHNLRTTVSVMGLNAALQPHLDALENGTPAPEIFLQHFLEVKKVAVAAMEEAKEFLAGLRRSAGD